MEEQRLFAGFPCYYRICVPSRTPLKSPDTPEGPVPKTYPTGRSGESQDLISRTRTFRSTGAMCTSVMSTIAMTTNGSVGLRLTRR
jgi:hypothetical protein